MRKKTALILVLSLVLAFSFSALAMADSNGAEIVEKEDGKYIYIPGKEAAGNAQVINPASDNPIRVAGD